MSSINSSFFGVVSTNPIFVINVLNFTLFNLKKLISVKTNTSHKIPISIKDKEQLFCKLKKAIESKRPKNCNTIILEIENYHLNVNDEKLFNDIKNLIKKYKFKEAILQL